MQLCKGVLYIALLRFTCRVVWYAGQEGTSWPAYQAVTYAD